MHYFNEYTNLVVIYWCPQGAAIFKASAFTRSPRVNVLLMENVG